MQLPNTARCLLAAAGIAAASMASTAAAQSTFTYQGVLEEGGSPVTGLENIRFRVYDAPTGGTLFGETTQNVDVTDGVFAAELNFGPLSTIDPASAWLEIAVNTGSGFETLGRQQITSAPFATNTRGLNVDPSGRLSVGTDSHQDILHIAGSNARILTESTSGSYSGIRSRVAGKEFFTGVDVFPGAANGDAGWHVFDNTGAGRLLALLPNGNFGVGISIPQARLDVAGGALFDGNVGIGTAPTGNDRLSVVGNGGGEFNVFNLGAGSGRQLVAGFFGNNAGPFARFQEVQGGNYADAGLAADGDFDLSINDQSRITVQPNGNVGIGTSSPPAALSVVGFNDVIDFTQQGVHIGQIPFANGSGASVNLVGGSEGAQLRFFDTAQSASARLWYFPSTKEIRIDGAASFLAGFRVRTDLLVEGSAFKPGGGSWSNLSDRNLKKNIAELDGALDTILALKGVTYEYKDAEAIGELSGTRTGFIAQDVEQVMPDWVDEGEDGYKRLTIRGFEAMAVEAFREQQEQIAALEAQIESMQAQRSVVGASMVWPVLLGGGVLGGLAVARRRHANNAAKA